MRPMLETTTTYRPGRPRFDGVAATAKEFENLPDDGYRYELHEGIICVSPSPGLRHENVVSFIHGELFSFLKGRSLGRVFTSEYDVQLTPKRRYKPDVKFVSTANRDIIREKRIHGAPDLVVEVVSPDNPDRDWRIKFDAYEKAGVREYWIIVADGLAAALYVHDGKRFIKQTVKGTRFASTVIKGFRLDLKALSAYVNEPMDSDEN